MFGVMLAFGEVPAQEPDGVWLSPETVQLISWVSTHGDDPFIVVIPDRDSESEAEEKVKRSPVLVRGIVLRKSTHVTFIVREDGDHESWSSRPNSMTKIGGGILPLKPVEDLRVRNEQEAQRYFQGTKIHRGEGMVIFRFTDEGKVRMKHKSEITDPVMLGVLGLP